MKRFLFNAAVYVFGDMFPRAVSFLLLPLYALYLTPADYGITSAMVTFNSFATILIGLGFGPALMRTFFRHTLLSRRQEHVNSVWIANQAWSLAATVLLLVAAPVIGPLLYKNVPYYPYFYITIGTIWLSNMSTIPLTLLKAEERAAAFSGLGVARTVLLAATTIGMVVLLRLGALGSLLAHLLSSSMMAVVYWALMRKWLSMRVNTSDVVEVSQIGLPLVPHIMVGWVMTLGDRWFIERFHGLEALGIYAIGYQVGQLLEYLVDAGTRAISPSLFRQAEKGNWRSVNGLVQVTFATVTVAGIALGLVSPELVELMVGDRYLGAAIIAAWVSFSGIFKGFYTLAVSTIFISGRTKLLPLISGTAAVGNIILNLLLIPKYGIRGAAWSTVASYAILFLAVYLYSQRLVRVDWGWKRLGWLALPLILAVVSLPWLAELPTAERLAVKAFGLLGSVALAFVVVRPALSELSARGSGAL